MTGSDAGGVPAVKRGKMGGRLARAWRILLDREDIRNQLPEDAMPRRKALLEQKSSVTARISETTRTIAFGVLASCYALLIANDKVTGYFVPVRGWLLGGALCALLGIVFDALQYLFGYINVQQGLLHARQEFPKNWSRDGRQVCFLLKQLFAYLAGAILIASIAVVILTPQQAVEQPAAGAAPG